MKAKLLQANEIDRVEWDAFVRQSPQGMFYMLSDYMDAAAPGWCGITVVKDGKMIGIMPLHIRKKLLIQYAVQPFFTQYWGPLFSTESNANIYKEFSNKRKILSEIISAIPSGLKLVSFCCSPAFDYGIPFHWNKYQLFTRYNFRIQPQLDTEKLLSGFASNTRQDVKKGSQWEANYTEQGSADELIYLIKKNLAAGKKVIPENALPDLERVVTYLLISKSGKIRLIKKENGEVLAAIVIVNFLNSSTYLVGAADPNENDSGAISWLLFRSLSEAGKANQIFDFEGSMIESIESFFRGFGGKPVPYLHIYRNRLPLFLRWIKK